MLSFTSEELEQFGIPYQKTSQFIFRNRLFSKGPSFSKAAREIAIALYKHYRATGTICLLVESEDYVTLCRQRLT